MKSRRKGCYAIIEIVDIGDVLSESPKGWTPDDIKGTSIKREDIYE